MAKLAMELRYAVRLLVILKYFGQLCLVLAALTLVPFLVSVILGDVPVSRRYGMVIAGITILGFSLSRLRTPSRIQDNEGIVLATLILVFTPLVMSYPLMGSGLGFIDALFEAISGVTTTGLSMSSALTHKPPTFLFARAWMQWYGGMGIVVLSLALVMQPGLQAKWLAVKDSKIGDLVGGTRAHARRVLKVYVLLTVLGIMGSLLVGIDFFDAMMYTFSAVSTGGFSPYDDSLAMLDWPAQVWIMMTCLAGAVPLMFYHRILWEKRFAAADLLQLLAIIAAALIISLAMAALWLSAGMAWRQVIHHAPLIAFSAQSTTGFSSIPCEQLDEGSKLVLILSMIVGGGTGSTAGGFKLLRFLIAVGVLRVVILKTCLPKHAVIEHQMAGHRLQEEEIHSALLLILLFVAVIALSWLPFLIMGFSPLDSLFEVVSATGTVGLSVGLTTSELPTLLKGILCADMLMGRLEILAWLVMLYPGTWFGRRMKET
ncbi:MAG: potassium transporter TrkG [Syntrophus sp. (in: bacteria)]|nr:potassium transporter TrkG [Syntrophus sp. (in: bacteria)]